MLGDRIKEIMKLKKITSKELSNIVDVTPTHISYILNNKRDPSMDLLNKMANALNVAIDDFFENEGETPKFEKPNLTRDTLDIDIPEEFINADKAREYIGMHRIFASEGFNLNTMDDEEVLSFANALLEQMRLVGYKYKK